MEERVCPVCDVWLEVDEVFDSYIGIDEREEEWIGHCPRCKQCYHWTEVYAHKKTKNFETYTEEEN